LGFWKTNEHIPEFQTIIVTTDGKDTMRGGPAAPAGHFIIFHHKKIEEEEQTASKYQWHPGVSSVGPKPVGRILGFYKEGEGVAVIRQFDPLGKMHKELGKGPFVAVALGAVASAYPTAKIQFKKIGKKHAGEIELILKAGDFTTEHLLKGQLTGSQLLNAVQAHLSSRHSINASDLKLGEIKHLY
jgi:hypothetical protein